MIPKSDPDPAPTPQPKPGPLKNSGKAIAALSLAALVMLAALEGGLDRDAKIGSIFILAIALWLAFRSYRDVKAGIRKGRGLSITAIALAGLTTLGSLGWLTQSDPPPSPLVNNIFEPASIVTPSPEPAPPPVKATPVKIDPPAPSRRRAKDVHARAPQDEPAPLVEAADFRGIWQDGHDFTIFYMLRQENEAVYLQQYNGYGALTFEATGVPNGTKLKIDHPRLSVNLALSDGGDQLAGNTQDKVNGLSRPVLLRRVDLDALDPQIAQLLIPLVQ